MQEKLKQYANIKLQIKVLEEVRKGMEEEVVEIIKKEVKAVDGKRKLETELGSFSVYKKVTSWKYTEAVEKIEEKLKIAKFTEQEKGIATAVEKEVLSFSETK